MSSARATSRRSARHSRTRPRRTRRFARTSTSLASASRLLRSHRLRSRIMFRTRSAITPRCWRLSSSASSGKRSAVILTLRDPTRTRDSTCLISRTRRRSMPRCRNGAGAGSTPSTTARSSIRRRAMDRSQYADRWIGKRRAGQMPARRLLCAGRAALPRPWSNASSPFCVIPVHPCPLVGPRGYVGLGDSAGGDYAISFSASSTSSVCPFTLTFGNTRRTMPALSMTKVVRSIPMNSRPYSDFILYTP